MTNTKSTRIIAIGVAVFVLGGALLFLLLRNSGGKSSPSAATKAAVVTPTTIAPGSVIIPSSPPTTLQLQFKIPAGLNAVSIPADYFAGVAGYVKAGDKVNLYTFLNKDCLTKDTPATVKLFLSNVQVLEVLSSVPAQTGAPASYLLALAPQDVEHLLFFQHFYGIWMSLTTNNEPAVASTGVTCSNAF